jgi:hypothetical protein
MGGVEALTDVGVLAAGFVELALELARREDLGAIDTVPFLLRMLTRPDLFRETAQRAGPSCTPK